VLSLAPLVPACVGIALFAEDLLRVGVESQRLGAAPVIQECADAELVLHRRQFVISDDRHPAPGWRHAEVADGRHLSWHPDLSVDHRPDEHIHILGVPSTDLGSGRYIVIEKGTLRGAHGCLLGVYYGASNGKSVITSSPGLAAELLGCARKNTVLRWGKGINWFPSPGAPVQGVFRLLFDQQIDVATLAVTSLSRRIEPWGSPRTGADKLAQHLAATCGRASGELVLALTAGLDSRVLLAALLATGVRFRAFTSLVSEASHIDIDIARALATRYGFEHRVVEPVPGGEQDLALWRIHTGWSVSDADDNKLVPGRQYRFLGSEDVVLRGGCFELGRRFFERRLSDLSSVPRAEEIESRFDGPRFTDEDDRSLEAWIDWRRAHPIGLSFVDSFYLDQRIGGWLASIEQGLDIFPFISVHPGNSDAAFAALMSYEDPRQAREGRIQRLAATSMCRDILDVPVNPTPTLRKLTRQVRSRLRAMRRRWSG
jgi:hypothetical protein